MKTNNEYPKINSLWMRDTKNNNTIIEGKLSKPEFAIIKEWHLFEKIHPKFDSLSDLLF